MGTNNALFRRGNEWTVKTRRVDRPDLVRLRLTAAEVGRRVDEKLDAEMVKICQGLGLEPGPWLTGGEYRRDDS